MQIQVQQLATEIHDGDWHDKPLRWTVQGPASEVQNFSTKKDAMKYASCRRKSADFNAATTAFLKAVL